MTLADLLEALERHAAQTGGSWGPLAAWREDPTTGEVTVVTWAGQKARVNPAGEVQLLLGPATAGTELVEAPAPAAPAAEVSDDLPPLEAAEGAAGATAAPVPASPPLEEARTQEILAAFEQGEPAELIELHRVERFRGRDGLWYFRGLARNGEIVYASEGYRRRGDATRAARSLAARFGVEVGDAEG
jgi:uncharacterized protein YegP (UPF0339 family)